MLDSGNPKDCSLPGSSVHGISQAEILEIGRHFLVRCLPKVQVSGVLAHLGSEKDLCVQGNSQILFLLIPNQKGWKKLEILIWRFVIRYLRKKEDFRI